MYTPGTPDLQSHGGCADAMLREEVLTASPHLRPAPDQGIRSRQTVQDPPPVRLRHRPAVEQQHHPGVGPRPDQPSESLLQLERGQGDEIAREAVDATFLES